MSFDGINRKKITPRKHPVDNFSFSEGTNDDNRQEAYSNSKNNFNEELFKGYPSKEKKFGWKFLKKFFYVVSLLLFLIILTIGLYFVWKISNASVKMSGNSSNKNSSILQTISDLRQKKRIELKGEKNNRINILLLGVAGKGNAGGNLTDTIMIVSINTKGDTIALLSLPRDLYISTPNTNYQGKINALYKYGLNNNLGIKPLEKTITQITGLNIDYFCVANFSGFEKFIDVINGINIQVERDIYDPHYPGPNYSYELFEIKKGFHKMDGSTALKYARERHNDPDGDFGRAKRQQQVLQSVKNKVFSTQILFNPFKLNAILDTLGDNIKTDASLPEIKSFLELLKRLDTQNINNVVVDAWKKDSLLKVSHIFTANGTRIFILVPRVGNYSEIKDLAKNIFNLNILKHRQEQIQIENATVAIVNKSNDYNLTGEIKKLLKDKLNFENIIILKDNSGKENISKTKIIDLSTGTKPFSLDELIKKLPATLSTDTSNSNILTVENSDKYSTNNFDFVIFLGDDLVELYKYKEDSIKDLNQI